MPSFTTQTLLAAASLRLSRSYQPETMEWLRRNTPSEARIESLKFNTVMLITDRQSFPPPLRLPGPAEWAAASRAAGISFVHVEKALGSFANRFLRCVFYLYPVIGLIPRVGDKNSSGASGDFSTVQ